jgi:cytochrome b
MFNTHRIYVWSAVTRLFHWGLVAAFITTLVSACFENALLIHVSAGSTMAILLTLRILWGFTGPTYSQFKNFDFNLKDLFYYFANVFKDRKLYVGHNPAASWATFLLIVLGTLTSLTGWMLMGANEVRGFWAFLAQRDEAGHILRFLHILGKDIMLGVAVVHIIGATLEHFWHKTSIISSMVHGFKKAPLHVKSVRPTRMQNRLGMGFLVLAFVTGVGVWKWEESPLIGAHPDLIYYHEVFPEYAKECTSCHALMPPFVLPQKSWGIVLSSPKDHFFEDISNKVPHFESIKAYILDHSAQTAVNELAKGVTKSARGKNIYRVTRTRYWKDIHANIPREAYEHPLIKSGSNCDACHRNFGLTNYINDEDISLKAFGIWESMKIYIKSSRER